MDRTADAPDRSADRPTARLFVVKLGLAVCIGGIAVFNGADDAWPFVGWPMYASFRYPGPPTQLVMHKIIATDDTGTKFTLAPEDIVTSNEINWLEKLAQSAADTSPTADADRRFLWALVEARLDSRAIRKLDIVRFAWSVDHTQTPPYDTDQPKQRRLIVRLTRTADGIEYRVFTTQTEPPP